MFEISEDFDILVIEHEKWFSKIFSNFYQNSLNFAIFQWNIALLLQRGHKYFPNMFFH